MSGATEERGTILVVDDTPTNLDLLADTLTQAGYKVLLKKDGESGIRLASKRRPDLILLDIMMPGIDGYETCRRLKAAPETQDVPVVFMSALSDTVDKVKGFEVGGVDYVTKPVQVAEVRARVETHLTLRRLRGELEARNRDLEHELLVARELVRQARERATGALVGHGPAVSRLREGIARRARAEAPVLLLGPGGCGEEEVARAIHHASERATGPFIHVDCLALQDSDEQVVFGGETPGKWQLAASGTIYFDVVEALSLEGQRRLAARTWSDTAEGHAPRVIASSRVDLASETTFPGIAPELHGAWSRLEVPTLAQRSEDVGAIAHDFLARRMRRMGRHLEGLDAESLERLRMHSWTGNLDELAGVLECALLASSGPTVSVDPTLLSGGRRLGSYELVEKIGDGAQGEVWRAQHRLLVHPAAVKLVKVGRPETRGDRSTVLDRFEREARATASLRSPNTVRLHDYGVRDDGTLYYVMELLDGIDLHDLVKRFGPQPVERTIALMSQACGSLAEAHAAGLVHRDLKPANMLACRMGIDHDVLKVVDFGLVTAAAERGSGAGGAARGLLGTPACLAPECIEDDETDHRADIYALGCITFWLLTGRHVFVASDLGTLLRAHVGEAPQPPSQLASAAVPAELDALVLACLDKDPGRRPRSAEALLERLRAVPVAEPWTPARAREWWRQRDVRPVRASRLASMSTSDVDATVAD